MANHIMQCLFQEISIDGNAGSLCREIRGAVNLFPETSRRDAAGAGRGRIVPQIIVEPAVRLNEDRSAGDAGVPCGHRKDDT